MLLCHHYGTCLPLVPFGTESGQPFLAASRAVQNALLPEVKTTAGSADTRFIWADNTGMGTAAADAAIAIAYSPDIHRWLRLKETGAKRSDGVKILTYGELSIRYSTFELRNYAI